VKAATEPALHGLAILAILMAVLLALAILLAFGASLP
jgi:hypothetical protein